MTLCPIALAAGCRKCPAFSVCPLKSVIGDFKKPEDDLRFDYLYERESELGKLLKNVYFRVALVLGLVVGYDLYQWLQR